MTALALAPELAPTTGAPQARTGTRTGTPGRRVPRSRPVGKPGNCPAPELGRARTIGARSCAAGGERAAGAGVEPQWRLTERGIAVVLTLAVLLGVAAMVCVGVRAVQVTSPDHQPAAASGIR